MAAKSVVEDGIRWSIGNGESVQILKDKWIPKPNTYKITTPINPLLYNEKVSTLIDKEKAVWKSERINSIFLPHDVDSILSIPLSFASPVDHRVWSATANGVFSVHSAYRICHKQLTKVEVGECSSNTRMTSLQKSIWQLRCPNKIKNFIWRACKDILPTKTKLRDRKIPLDVECDICGGVETAGHVFWSYELAVAVWQMANLKAPGLTTNPPNFLDLFWCVKEAKPSQDLEAFATFAWSLWNNRNAVRHGEAGITALQIFEASHAFLNEFQACCVLPHPPLPHGPSLWRPPHLDCYKVNVDGAVFKDRGHCGIGVVVRNDKRQIMGALSELFPYPLSALEIEAKAAEFGTTFAQVLGLREIILEGDSQTVMAAIANHDSGPIQVQNLIAGIKSWESKFRVWQSSFTRRDRNKVAHQMAKYAKHIFDCIIWVEDTPPIIASQILHDVSVLGFSPIQ